MELVISLHMSSSVSGLPARPLSAKPSHWPASFSTLPFISEAFKVRMFSSKTQCVPLIS